MVGGWVMGGAVVVFDPEEPTCALSVERGAGCGARAPC